MDYLDQEVFEDKVAVLWSRFVNIRAIPEEREFADKESVFRDFSELDKIFRLDTAEDDKEIKRMMKKIQETKYRDQTHEEIEEKENIISIRFIDLKYT